MLNWEWERKTSWGLIQVSWKSVWYFLCKPADRLSEDVTQWQDVTSFGYRETLSFTVSGLFGQNRLLMCWKKKKKRDFMRRSRSNTHFSWWQLWWTREDPDCREDKEKRKTWVTSFHLFPALLVILEKSPLNQNQCRDVFLYWLNETHLFFLLDFSPRHGLKRHFY